jgi:hypothetical protein
MDDWTINMVFCTDTILQDVGAAEATQKDVALTYAMAIKSHAQGADKPDWSTINKAIIARWNMKALERIKKRAFDILAGKVDPKKKM